MCLEHRAGVVTISWVPLSPPLLLLWSSGLGAPSGLSGLVLGEGLQKIWAALLFLQHVFLPFWTGKCSVRGGSLVSGTVVNLF